MNAVDAFRSLSQQQRCVFLDSARGGTDRSRYSFVAADPFEVIVGGEGDSLDTLERRLAEFSTATIPELPPLQGGAIGFFAYDLARNLEKLPPPRHDEFQLPMLCFGLYDVVLAFDHQTDDAWLISQGYPETNTEARSRRAKERAEQVLSWLGSVESGKRAPAKVGELCTQFETGYDGIRSNFSAEGFVEAVSQGIEYIFAGDVFQVNLAQRLVCPAATDSVSLYLKLRECNAAPFAGYLDLGEHQIISASPERFLKVTDRCVETRPIKGTRPRQVAPEADLFAGAELSASGKDLAENVMIVDLMRNDLSRVSEDDSVRVTQLCELEVYEHVQHLVSVVEGRLRDGVTNVEVVRRTFPGGSITGAPKVRAMEIIAELEPTSRGAYCGSMGYLGFDGAMDLNILIRTITASRGWWQFPVGGGIVAQSVPESERRETWTKAEGILQAVSGWTDARSSEATSR